ncbi:MAG: phospholipase D-like domain-containing protein [Propionibacteriaceae bacterium]|nr:phospholipase D-like domain-containing protein [Propionibacteriaceae bacterium]
MSLVLSSVGPASALTYSSSGGKLIVPTADTCPTVTDAPRAVEVWLNTTDSETRGWWDPKNNDPWDFSIKMGQLVCGAAPNASIRVGMYFVRSIGTATRKESDPDAIFDALVYLHTKKNANVEMVLENFQHTGVDRERIMTKWSQIGTVRFCRNGCLNYNKESVYYAIEHEKYITISDTNYPGETSGVHPMLISSSGNLARSQIRNYWQEAVAVYDDKELNRQFVLRHDALWSCGATSSPKAEGCKTKTTAIAAAALKSEHKIWYDPIQRHATDSGRGTFVSFSPQKYSVTNFYITEFNRTDCTVDKRVRVAMFKLTGTRALDMAKALSALVKRGCQVEVLLSSDGGSHVVDKAALKILKAAKITTRCSMIAMHTKLVMIGPMVGDDGIVMAGSVNMSLAAMRRNDEHVLTFDTRRADGAYKEDLRRAYAQYAAGFDELNRNNEAC